MRMKFGAPHSLFPSGVAPVCEAAGCEVELRQGHARYDDHGRIAYDVASDGRTRFGHFSTSGDHDTLPLEDAWIRDGEFDIWSDHVKPWLDQLHAQEIAP